MSLLPEMPHRGKPDRVRLDSNDLRRLAETLSGRITLQCPKCSNRLTLRLEARELRFGSSPDLSAIDASQPGRPRLQFWCIYCHRTIGYIQGDEWAAETTQEDVITRWDRLEIDEQRREDEGTAG